MKLIDVSHWQGNINWSKVAKDGIKGAYIKATEGSAAGSAFVDSKMDANFKGATAQGLHTGLYHYAKFVSVNDAIAEAKWFVQHIKKYKFTLPPMLDLEENHCGSATYMNKAAKAFMECVEKEVGSVGLYSFGVFFANNVDKSLLKKYAYWHARYANDPVNVKLNDIYLWQYSDKGKVAGIVGPVDMNKAGGAFFTLGGKATEKPKDSAKNDKKGLTDVEAKELQKQIDALKKSIQNVNGKVMNVNDKVLAKANAPAKGNTPDPSHKDNVEWAKKNGISNGKDPHDYSTREQDITMLHNFFKTFVQNDAATEDYAKEALAWAEDNGVSNAKNPAYLSSRQQVITIVYRAIMLVQKDIQKAVQDSIRIEKNRETT